VIRVSGTDHDARREAVEEFREWLREWAEDAYPLDVFPKMTDDERKQIPRGFCDRIAAGMGRHTAKQILDRFDKLDAGAASERERKPGEADICHDCDVDRKAAELINEKDATLRAVEEQAQSGIGTTKTSDQAQAALRGILAIVREGKDGQS
jgi:hypothetical protein